MGVGEDSRAFYNNLAVTNCGSISDRCGLITRRFKLEFWNSDSRVNHSIYMPVFEACYPVNSMRT